MFLVFGKIFCNCMKGVNKTGKDESVKKMIAEGKG